MSLQAMKWAFETLKTNRLGPTERAVLFYLCWKHHPKTGACYPAMGTIAEHSGVSERRARTAIRTLEEHGLVQSSRRCGQAGNSSNQYTLLQHVGNAHTGRKKQSETGNHVPIPDRQTLADDRVNPLEGKKEGFLAKKKTMKGNA